MTTRQDIWRVAFFEGDRQDRARLLADHLKAYHDRNPVGLPIYQCQVYTARHIGELSAPASKEAACS